MRLLFLTGALVLIAPTTLSADARPLRWSFSVDCEPSDARVPIPLPRAKAPVALPEVLGPWRCEISSESRGQPAAPTRTLRCSADSWATAVTDETTFDRVGGGFSLPALTLERGEHSCLVAVGRD